MYSKQETSLLKKKFWTSFGQYMRPVPGADGEPVNWINYKTGIRHLFFRMDVDNRSAGIAIELRHPDPGMQLEMFEKFKGLKTVLEDTTGEKWDWHPHYRDEDGNMVSRIGKSLDRVSILSEDDWPVIISFWKPRIIALDAFWTSVHSLFE